MLHRVVVSVCLLVCLGVSAATGLARSAEPMNPSAQSAVSTPAMAAERIASTGVTVFLKDGREFTG